MVLRPDLFFSHSVETKLKMSKPCSGEFYNLLAHNMHMSIFSVFYSFFNSWHRLDIEHVMFSWMIKFALTKSMFLDSFELVRDMLLSTILDSGSLKSPWLLDTYWVPFL